MLLLTTKVALPDVVRLKVRRPQFDYDTNELGLTCDAIGQGGVVYKSYSLIVRDGICTGLKANPLPVSYDDRLIGFSLTVANGYTAARAAFMAGNGPASQLRALEASLRDAGVLPAGDVS